MNRATAGTIGVRRQRNYPTEPLWPPFVAMLAVVGLYAVSPASLLGGVPRWLFAALVVGLLVLILISHRRGNHALNQLLGYILNSVVTAAMILSLTLLITEVTQHQVTPQRLLRSAAALWVSNFLVFAAWYWRLDGGGPHQRALTPGHTDGAFLFPQMTMHPEAKSAAGEAGLGTKLRRLPVPGIQHQHRLLTHRRTCPVTLGEDSDDDSSADFFGCYCLAGRSGGEYPLRDSATRCPTVWSCFQ